jgi:hypothetical protein
MCFLCIVCLFYIGWVDCLSNMHAKPIALICFSMNLYFAHTPTSIWKMLSLLRLAISHTTTMKLYNIAMQIPIHQQLSWDVHPTTAVIGADNMHYITYV